MKTTELTQEELETMVLSIGPLATLNTFRLEKALLPKLEKIRLDQMARVGAIYDKYGIIR